MKRTVALLLSILLSALSAVTVSAVYGDNDVPDDWDSEYALGDINGDKSVDSLDLMALRRHLAGLSSDGTTFVSKAADMDGSGTIDSLDLMSLRRKLAGLS